MQVSTKIQELVNNPQECIQKWICKSYNEGPTKVYSKSGSTRNEWCYQHFGLSYISVYKIIVKKRFVSFPTFRKICDAQQIDLPIVHEMLSEARDQGLIEELKNQTTCGYVMHYINTSAKTMEINKYFDCVNWLYTRKGFNYLPFLKQCCKKFL